MTSVWLVTYDDQDYYCEGHHLVGVYASEELARTSASLHRNNPEAFGRGAYDYNVDEWPVETTPRATCDAPPRWAAEGGNGD